MGISEYLISNSVMYMFMIVNVNMIVVLVAHPRNRGWLSAEFAGAPGSPSGVAACVCRSSLQLRSEARSGSSSVRSTRSVRPSEPQEVI